MGTVGLLLAGTLVGSSVHADVPLAAVLLCSCGYFFSYIQLAAWWAAMGDVGGRHLGEARVHFLAGEPLVSHGAELPFERAW